MSRELILELMSFIGNLAPKEVLGQIAFDELGRLIPTLAKRELHRGHGTLHAPGLSITEHQFALVVHQIDELMDVVSQHTGEHLRTEAINQTTRRFRTDGRNLLDRVHQNIPLRLGHGSRSHQAPQSLATLLATRLLFVQCTLDLIKWHRRIAIARRIDQVNTTPRTRSVAQALGCTRSPIEAHPHSDPSHDEKLRLLRFHFDLTKL